MHDIWNPWHGCIKCSPGCQNCYMYYLDKINDNNGSDIYKTKNFEYPLQKGRNGNYKLKAGERIRVCMTSDFFLKEADEWREECWNIMRTRKDILFFLLTKRAERIKECLPDDWNNGWENIMLNVTCENQEKADERIPILFSIPAKHKGIMCAPIISKIDISSYLKEGILEQVICGGENYDGARPCDYDWIKSLYEQCKETDTTFNFIEVGNYFIKDDKTFTMFDKQLQAEKAYKLKFNHLGKQFEYKFYDGEGNLIPKEDLYVPMFNTDRCIMCSSRLICNGCHNCGKCKNVTLVSNEEFLKIDQNYISGL